jgi:hypothetical protein
LRGILNSGHSRGWPYIRWDPKSRERDECATFAMALIGGIGDLPDTIEDRAVVVSMRRRASGEPVKQFRRRREIGQLHDLRDRLNAWVTSIAGHLELAEPDLPVDDRQADVWESLIAIADAAGGAWPELARAACEELCGTTSSADEGTLGERLLSDLYAVWRDHEEHVFTTTLIDRLKLIEEAPWEDGWGNPPKPLTARRMASLLRPYGVKPRNVWESGPGVQAKGYYRDDLADSWQRYVQAVQASKTPGLPYGSSGRIGGRIEQPEASNETSDESQGTQATLDGWTDRTDARLERATCDLCGEAGGHADWCGAP